MRKITYVWLVQLMLYLMLATGCVVDDQRAFTYSAKDRAIVKRGVIENMTTTMLEQVEVLHLPTRAITSVSAIYPGTSAEIGFRPTQLLADYAVLSWVQKGKQMKVDLEVPQVAEARNKGPLTLVYRVFPDSHVTVQLEYKSEKDRN
ncbi:MAG: hypothetical protein JKY48_05845 [Flavobacteriales bacterium]|nr:hypothetical protein [Flavobacteriales bacterium]